MAQHRRNKWSRLHLPHELVGMVNLIASKHGYRDAQHKFIYHLLKEVYPEDVELMSAFLETDWLGDTPPDE